LRCFPFLLLKTLSQSDAAARSQSAGAGGGCWIPFQEHRKAALGNANRLYFAEQIPQLAKSQPERLTLPKEEGIQDKSSSQPIRTSPKSQPEATRKRETTVRKGKGPRDHRNRFSGHFPKISFATPVGFSLPVLDVYNLTLVARRGGQTCGAYLPTQSRYGALTSSFSGDIREAQGHSQIHVRRSLGCKQLNRMSTND
jgi:hypothetical protein